MIIDLHTHSTISDGSLTPEELVEKAVGNGVEVLAMCDHDTTDGQKRFFDSCDKFNIKGIVSIEVSAVYDGGNCHLLGYGVSDKSLELEKLLAKVRNSRSERNEKIIKNLNSVGINITMDEVLEIAGGDVIARPHIARAMLQKGTVESVQEAFDKYLTKGKIGYIHRYQIDPEIAVKILTEAGAKVVLAHPTQLNSSEEIIDKFLSKLKKVGLWGLEVYTPYTPKNLIDPYINIAKKNGLKITAGSDFHGASKPAHFLGELRNGEKINSSLKDLVSIDELLGR